MFKHKIFAKTAAHNPHLLERLSKWSKGLRWYLSFFPEVAELAYLRKLEKEVTTHTRHKTPTRKERSMSPATAHSDMPERNASPGPSVGRGTSPKLVGVRPSSPGQPVIRYPQ